MTQFNNEMEFHAALMTAIAEHPSWLSAALDAISSGMVAALNASENQTRKYDLAFRSALALASSNRLTEKTKVLLNETITSMINPNCVSEVEKSFLSG